LSLVSVAERAVGLGGRVGTDTRGPFTVSALKGTRLEAVVRYQLWSDTPVGVDAAIQDLATRLLADREVLRAAGFLRLTLKGAGASENVPALNFWRESAEFAVLYEFPYVDADDAESLIGRIPIEINEEFSESMTVTDEMVRWDDQPAPPPPLPPSAPPLLLRGALSIGRLSALAFIPGTAPTGTVTLTRTFDGAPGPPPTHPDLPTFLAAITNPVNPAREGRITFASLTAFLAAFSTSFKITRQSLENLKAEGVPDDVLKQLKSIQEQEVEGEGEFLNLLKETIGDAQTTNFKAVILKHSGREITLGDWDEDIVPDEYKSLALTINPAIKLPTVADRFEISYETPAFDHVAVVYLRATRGGTS
jgi:hypothetical protein